MSSLAELNSHLFEQLDRLAKSQPQDLDIEVKRANAMQQISKEVLKAHELQLDAIKTVAQYKGLGQQQKTPVIPDGNLLLGTKEDA